MMLEHGIRHLPVKEDGRLVGVLTERDLDRALGPAPSAERRARVRHACASEAYAVGLEEPLDRVAAAMAERRLDAVLVVKEGRLAGIFTAVDACRCLAQALEAQYGPGRVDGGDEAA